MPWVGLAWPLSDFLEELPYSLYFPLISCFLFLIILPAIVTFSPPHLSNQDVAGRRFIFKNKGKGVARSCLMGTVSVGEEESGRRGR